MQHFIYYLLISSLDSKRQASELERRGSYSKLLTQLTAQLPSFIKWEESFVPLCTIVLNAR